MKQILSKITEGYFLEKGEASEIIYKLGEEKTNRDLVNTLISVFLNRELTTDELNGFRLALLDRATNPQLITTDAIDVCGTGGDGKNTFNISTLSAIVTAAAGVPVIKHGNYGVSSFCGSSDILNYFGYNFSDVSTILNQQLEKNNIVFLHAPLFHPVLKEVAEFRKSIGIKTLFNQLGPLINPAKPVYRVNGTYNLNLLSKYASIYSSEKYKYKLIHSIDGSDEITLANDFLLHTDKGISYMEPTDLGFEYQHFSNSFGGDTFEESAQIFISILNNSAKREQINIVIANAALAIQCYKNSTLEEAIEIAKETIESKKAIKLFKKLVS